MEQVCDPRRAQGKRYDLQHVLLYCVLAVVSGATSYRRSTSSSTRTGLGSMRCSAAAGSAYRPTRHCAVILQGLDASQMEGAMRHLAGEQVNSPGTAPLRPASSPTNYAGTSRP
ncbi:transposase family protein [Caldimonas tepidiphila]|uniref:transposase family protein n=1 Tax=Caldimonas tepidiphila TaxID=2315841 RepID=UPI000E5A222F